MKKITISDQSKIILMGHTANYPSTVKEAQKIIDSYNKTISESSNITYKTSGTSTKEKPLKSMHATYKVL